MPTYVDTILCESIRLEANNKMSLLGVFGDAILVPEIPTVLATLALVQRWQPAANEPEGARFLFTFQIRRPGMEPIQLPGGEPASVPTGPRPVMNFILQLFGFPIPQEGDYEVVTFIDGVQRHVYGFFVGQPSQQHREGLIGFQRSS